MKETIKNIIEGASTVLDLSGRDPVSPSKFNTRTYTYRGAVKSSIRGDSAKIRSDMSKAFNRVVPKNDTKK